MPSIRSYIQETRRPIYSAALVLPFFLIYHLGTLLFETTYINGADALIIQILRLFSVNTMFASALVLLTCFVIWQLRSKASWEIDTTKLLILFGESLLYAMILFYLLGWLALPLNASAGGRGLLRGIEQLVLYCGAGVYEELVFRGFLLGSLILVLQRGFSLKQKSAAIWAMVISSLLFSIFHYIGPSGDSFSIGSFLQRALGGLYFAVIFVTRGFGLAAAAHAIYDMLVAFSRL
jgi:membrane protease YdiL (CAAX protease family)